MANGYVGIASHQGLCRIEIERHDTLRRAQGLVGAGRKQTRVAFWAVLPIEAAHDIFALLDEGENTAALRLLNQAAREGGHLLALNQ